MSEHWNPQLEMLLTTTENAMHARRTDYRGPVRVGVDLGTAYTVLLVLDENGEPIEVPVTWNAPAPDGTSSRRMPSLRATHAACIGAAPPNATMV